MITAEEIRKAVTDAISEHPAFDPELHAEHHAWIKERIESEKRKKEFYGELTKSVAQWSVVAVLGGITYWFKQHWN